MSNDKLLVYVAGAWESRDRLQPIADAVDSIDGLSLHSRWIREPEPVGADEGGEHVAEHALRCAHRDASEVMDSDVVILDTIQTNDRGGKDFEAGLAFAFGLEWWIVGPYRNVFQRMADRHFDTWAEALEALRGWQDWTWEAPNV